MLLWTWAKPLPKVTARRVLNRHAPVVLHSFHRFQHTLPARVRFAPSPTGYLHLGGLRTALYNYLLAKKTQGSFILRIEDTDRTRFVDGATDKLISALSWAGVKADEGPHQGGPHAPYFQSQRTDIYRHHSQTLINNGHAYRCFCTPDRLDDMRKEQAKKGKRIAYDRRCASLTNDQIEENLAMGMPFTVRLKTPKGMTQIDDFLHGKVNFNNAILDDSVLMKSDGFPTYHLANVVDDYLMGITHVLRGDEWLPSTPKHVLLYRAFGWKAPQFIHLPLLLNKDGSKLSKRSGDVHVEQYIDKGYFPEAVANFVALLGWAPPNAEEEIFTMDELLEKFDLTGLNKGQAVVSLEKLDWINKQHLLKRAQTAEGIQSMVDFLVPVIRERFTDSAPGGEASARLQPAYIADVLMTMKERIRNVMDIPDMCPYFFVEPAYDTEQANALRKKLKPNVIAAVNQDKTKRALEALAPFNTETISAFFQQIAADNNVKVNHVQMAMRYAMTGTNVGAAVNSTMVLLGKSSCVDRLEKSF